MIFFYLPPVVVADIDVGLGRVWFDCVILKFCLFCNWIGGSIKSGLLIDL